MSLVKDLVALSETTTEVGITANTNSAQGDTSLTATYNVISTCANAGDAVTLPAAFVIGQRVYVKNDGAENADVFPAAGHDAGGGANTAVVVDDGDFAVFIGTTASGASPDAAVWTKLMGGTA